MVNREFVTLSLHRLLNRRIWIARACFAAMLIFVVAVSIAPSPSVPEIGSDKLGHFIAYAGLQIVAGVAFYWRGSLWHFAIGLVVLGGVLELVQSLVPSRSAEWLDFFANTAGVIFASTVWAAIPTLRRRFASAPRPHPK